MTLSKRFRITPPCSARILSFTRAIYFGVGLVIAPICLRAQSATASVPPAGTTNDATITLDPFKVNVSGSVGYGAQFSNSSSRLNLRYIDVPQSLSVVTTEFLRDTFAFDSHDFVKFVNNVYPRTNTHQTETFFIRGLQVGNSYVDGFISTLAVNRDAALYDRIEYVKGPASAAMGRGEAGGLVNFVSKRPIKRRLDTFDFTAGSDSFYRAELDHNGLLTKDGRMSYRVPVYFEDGDNPRGGSLMHLRKYGIGPSLLWDISPRSQLSVTTSLFRFEGPGNVGEVYWSNPNIYRFQLELGQLAGSAWNPLAGDALVPDDRIYGFDGKGRQSEVAEISGVFTHKFNDMISYRQGLRFDNFDEEFRRFSLATVAVRNPQRAGDFLLGLTYLQQIQTRQSIRAQGDLLFERAIGSSSHQLLFGYDLFDNESTNLQGQRGGIPQSLYFPDYSLPAGFNPDTFITAFTTDTFSDGKGFAYYGQYSGDFFRKRINVMFGWRKDQTESVSHNNRNNTDVRTGKQVTDVPRYSITYKPTDSISIYYVHSEQADPSITTAKYSNFSPSAGATAPPPTDPRYDERLTSQVQAKLDDIGIKAHLFEQRVTAAFSIFKIRRSGFILNDFQAEPGSNGVGTVNYNRFYIVSGEEVRGFEAEVFGQPVRRLTLSANYASQSGEKPASTGKLVPIESLIDSMSINARYDFRDNNRNGFEVTGGGKLWLKGWVMSPGATVTFNGDQYTLDAGVNYHWSKGRYNVRARVNNLTNELVYMSQNSQWGLRRFYVSFGGRF